MFFCRSYSLLFSHGIGLIFTARYEESVLKLDDVTKSATPWIRSSRPRWNSTSCFQSKHFESLIGIASSVESIAPFANLVSMPLRSDDRFSVSKRFFESNYRQVTKTAVLFANPRQRDIFHLADGLADCEKAYSNSSEFLTENQNPEAEVIWRLGRDKIHQWKLWDRHLFIRFGLTFLKNTGIF